MANKIVKLEYGLEFDHVLQTEVELRDLTAGDILTAEEQSEKLYFAPGNIPMVVSSPVKATQIVLSRIIIRIGDKKGPFPKMVLDNLHFADYAELVEAYRQMRGENDLAEAGRNSSPLQSND